MDPKLTWYLAGPMTGRPQFNFPLFERVSAALREQGYTVISPAELDSPAVQKAAMESDDGAQVDGGLAGETWGDMLARDVKLLADECGGIVLLPGWGDSKGARLEAFVSLLCDNQFARWDEDEQTMVSLPRENVEDNVL